MKFFLYIITSLLLISSAHGNLNFPSSEMNASIKFNNTVLARVNDKTITTYDVMKKLELGFNRAFPDLIDSIPSRFQFYSTGWQHALDELINNELMLLDAAKREIKISDAELREEIEAKFGPNVITNLQKLKLTHEEAMKITKDEMIIQRMMYFFIKSKADQKITPSALRNEYRLYCLENPPSETWTYHVISIRSDNEKISSDASSKIYNFLKNKNEDPIELESQIKSIEKDFPNCKISISSEYVVKNKEISSSQQKILSNLQKKSYSPVINQTSKTTNDKSNKIFYLKDYEKNLTKSFEEVSNNLKEKLLQNALIEESENYFSKLKKTYHVDKSSSITKDFLPFYVE